MFGWVTVGNVACMLMKNMKKPTKNILCPLGGMPLANAPEESPVKVPLFN